MAIRLDSTLADIAFAVNGVLESREIVGILCGGSAATYHSQGSYTSEDLDFVLRFGESAHDVATALAEIGFERAESMFVHALTRYTVDFPAGPLSLGSILIETHDIVRGEDGRTLHVITPHDSVCDRLLAMASWTDYSALRSAVAVCAAQPARVDLRAIETFLKREGGTAYRAAFASTYETFERRLRELPTYAEIAEPKSRTSLRGNSPTSRI